MSGLTALLNTGVSGLTAATEAMQTVSNNTANANTPGYNVESVAQVELPGVLGEPGLGTEVTSIQRGFDQFIYQQLVQAGSTNQAAQVNQTSIQNLSALFPVASGGANGIGAELTSFFAAVNGMSQDPSSVPERQVLLSSANALAATFNSVGSGIASNLTELNGQMTQAVQQINTLTQQIANCNTQIIAQAGTSAGPSDALLDNRDELVQQLGQQLGISIEPGADDAVDVYTAGGDALVSGGASYQLGTDSGSYGNGNVGITYAPTGQDLTDGISGGTIGGLLTARTQLASAQNSVGSLAVALADAVNTGQSLGLDLNGNLGSPLFSTQSPTVTAAVSNGGTATLTAAITNTNAFTPGDFLITDTASGFDAVNTLTGQSTALGSGPSLSLDGMTITVAGTAAVGDSFLLQPTADAAQSLKVVTTDAAAIAAASAYVVSSGNNAGTVQATVGNPVPASGLPAGTVVIPASQFGQDMTVQFTSATSFEVLSSSNAVIASGSFSGANGAELAIAYPPPAPSGEVATVSLSSGTPAAGDSFALTPGGPGSNGNIVAMAGLASQAVISGQTLSDAYASLVGVVGSNGQAASVAAQSAQGILTQAQTVQQSISGVNLDQQAADLVNYEQAYQASATVIGTVQTLFATLLTAVQAS
jgi:flagellar hook-associated protein 1 FlgK